MKSKSGKSTPSSSAKKKNVRDTVYAVVKDKEKTEKLLAEIMYALQIRPNLFQKLQQTNDSMFQTLTAMALQEYLGMLHTHLPVFTSQQMNSLCQGQLIVNYVLSSPEKLNVYHRLKKGIQADHEEIVRMEQELQEQLATPSKAIETPKKQHNVIGAKMVLDKATEQFDFDQAAASATKLGSKYQKADSDDDQLPKKRLIIDLSDEEKIERLQEDVGLSSCPKKEKHEQEEQAADHINEVPVVPSTISVRDEDIIELIASLKRVQRESQKLVIDLGVFGYK